jgi:hypothetical protein
MKENAQKEKRREEKRREREREERREKERVNRDRRLEEEQQRRRPARRQRQRERERGGWWWWGAHSPEHTPSFSPNQFSSACFARLSTSCSTERDVCDLVCLGAPAISSTNGSTISRSAIDSAAVLQSERRC